MPSASENPDGDDGFAGWLMKWWVSGVMKMEFLMGSGNFTLCVLVRFDFASHPIMRYAITLAAKPWYALHSSCWAGGIFLQPIREKIHVYMDFELFPTPVLFTCFDLSSDLNSKERSDPLRAKW